MPGVAFRALQRPGRLGISPDANSHHQTACRRPPRARSPARLPHACPARAKSRRPGPAGCTRSSTTARILARRDRTGVRLYTRNGYNAARFPMIVEAIASLPVRSCFIDGEAIVVDANGLSVFNMIRYRQHDRAAVLCAFDLIELDGEDLRLAPLQDRKRTLADLLGRKYPGIAVNTHYEGDGPIIFKHACALGCEGIVSKRLGSPYRSGRVDHWLKIKNPAAPAVRRERRRIGAASARGEGEHMAVVCPLKTVAEIASAIFGLAAACLAAISRLTTSD
jgi:bifunctional non-homologous end joining protein LigD